MGSNLESLSVESFYKSGEMRKHLRLKLIAGKGGLNRLIEDKAVNRPALALIGYFEIFGEKRVQFLGKGEIGYLRSLGKKQEAALIPLFEKAIPCLVFSSECAPLPILKKLAQKYNIPLFRTELKSRDFMAECTLLLETAFAERCTIQGTLLDIKGMGVLLEGKSGIGKSECALALVERGHSLVSDDMTCVRKLNDHQLLGSSPDLNRSYMECRGLGILNVVQLFGIRAFCPDKRIDLIITFVEWEEGMAEERTGLDIPSKTILGLEIPNIQIPVRPGRDLARLVEAAALAQALRGIGYNSAREYNKHLIQIMKGNGL